MEATSREVITDPFDLIEIIDSRECSPNNPLEEMEYEDLQISVRRVLATLSPREEKVLRMRFGIGEKQDHTLQEVGQDFEVGKERIRQIEAKAMRKLRHPSQSRHLKWFFNGAEPKAVTRATRRYEPRKPTEQELLEDRLKKEEERKKAALEEKRREAYDRKWKRKVRKLQKVRDKYPVQMEVIIDGETSLSTFVSDDWAKAVKKGDIPLRWNGKLIFPNYIEKRAFLPGVPSRLVYKSRGKHEPQMEILLPQERQGGD